MEQIYRSVSNWVARYEIWTLKTNPERTLELSIPLQNEDIWLQYQHSLSYATQSSGLALQFPISVSPCIQKFAILHNVYSLEVDERTSEVRLAKFSLPFGLDDTLASCWSPKEAANDTKFWKSSGSFFYFVVFGPTGKSVFCISRANQESQQYVNLAVFNIDVSGNPPAKLASPYAKFMPQSTGTLFCPPDTKHVLHPDLPLAIFTISGFAYIWIYRSSESSLRTPQILGVSALRTSHLDSTLWLLHSKFYFGDERYDSITFSEDGIHVILDGKTIIRLPDYSQKRDQLPPPLEKKVDFATVRGSPNRHQLYIVIVASACACTQGLALVGRGNQIENIRFLFSPFLPMPPLWPPKHKYNAASAIADEI